MGAQPDGLTWRANWALADDSDAGLAVAAGYEEDGSQGLAVSDKSGRVDLQVVRETATGRRAESLCLLVRWPAAYKMLPDSGKGGSGGGRSA